MLLSIVIPVHNAEKTLVDLLKSLNKQVVLHDCEVIFVDDNSDDQSRAIIEEYDFLFLPQSKNRGPAVCRNIGTAMAKGDIIVFTDSDCRVGDGWLEHIKNRFNDSNVDAVMGKLILDQSTYLGDAISALGYPAGGSIGFDKIWKVDEKGCTDSLSSCNCAIRKTVLDEIGGFDETFPYPGGEDTLLAVSLRKKGYRIHYCPEIVMYHAARTKIKDFVHWQFRRGISSYFFSKKITEKSSFIKLRLWSIKNILLHNKFDKKLPAIILLLTVGYLSQIAGYFLGNKELSGPIKINR